MTRNERASIIGLAVPWLLVLPAPDADITTADRQQLAYSFAGIEASAPAIPAGPLDILVLECTIARTVGLAASIARTVDLDSSIARTIDLEATI